MRVFLAEAELRVRDALRLVLSHEPGMEVVGEASTAWGLPDGVRKAAPDLVLLDWDLPGPPVADLLPALRANCRGARVIALSVKTEAEGLALTAGADAFVGKTDSPEHLLSVLRGAIHGN